MSTIVIKFSPKIFTITLLVVVCGFQADAQQLASRSEDATNRSITGKVFSDTGQPLAGATVSVRTAGTGLFVNRTTQTNSEGSFQVSGLDSGLYYVSASSPAYVLPPINSEEGLPMYRVGDSVRLELVRGGVITGTITNASGEPVVGVRVRLLMLKDGNGKEVKGRYAGGDKQTDDRGIYRIFGVSPGTYLVLSGGSGLQYNAVNATDFDAPTYAPSSTRDTASEVQVRNSEEVTVDIRYRYEQGHSISGTVKTTGTNGVSISLIQAGGPFTQFGSAYQPNGTKGFAFYGVSDGEYLVTAMESVTQVGNTFSEMAISDPLRVTVKGGDVTGIELVSKPLASISGKISLEPANLPECQNKRQPASNETMISVLQDKEDSQIDQLALIRPIASVSTPDKDWTFVLRNLRTGQYAFIPRFFARYWYLKSIMFAGPAQTTSTKGSAPAKDAARSWTVVKPGDRLNGLTITLSEGAASIKGQIAKEQAASGLRVYLVPSERDKADDPLRYFTSEIGGDGTFSVTNLPPGKYWTLAQQPQADTPTTTEKLRLPDAAEGRAKIRRAAETKKSEVELKPCQNLIDYSVPRN